MAATAEEPAKSAEPGLGPAEARDTYLWASNYIHLSN